MSQQRKNIKNYSHLSQALPTATETTATSYNANPIRTYIEELLRRDIATAWGVACPEEAVEFELDLDTGIPNLWTNYVRRIMHKELVVVEPRYEHSTSLGGTNSSNQK